MQISGAYPLLDISDNRTEEYKQISLLRNHNMTNKLLTWCYEALVKGALETDQIGFVCAVISDSSELAEKNTRDRKSLTRRIC